MATTVQQLREVIALVRSWGFIVTEEPGWETRCGKSAWTPCNAEYGIEHWTASPSTPTAYLRDGDPARGLKVLCNVQLKRDAMLRLIAGGYANHAGYVDARVPQWAASPLMDAEHAPGTDSATYSSNRYAIGMEGNAGPGAPYTDAQHAAATAWWAACAIVFGWRRDRPPVLGHKEVTRRKPGDPSHDMAARRRQVAAMIAAKTAKAAEPLVATTPLPKEDTVTKDQADRIIELLEAIARQTLTVSDALTPGEDGVKFDGHVFAQLRALVDKPAVGGGDPAQVAAEVAPLLEVVPRPV